MKPPLTQSTTLETIMPAKKDILFLTDSPGCGVAADLDILYPDRVQRLNFTTEKHGVTVLKQYDHVITLVADGLNLGKLRYEAVESYARQGGQVISCLFEYARHRGLNFSKTHVLNRMRPGMRVEVECDVTRGFAKGDETWWYGMVSSAPEQVYANQAFQRQILDVSESDAVRVLATSTVNGGATLVEEKVGKGRIIALDLLSPLRPFYNSWGSTNKYVFVGNAISGAVKYGKQYPEKWPYDDFVTEMHALAMRYPQITLRPEGPCSDGRELWTFEIGDPSKPTLYLGSAVHGWEWEACFGLLRLAELLCEDPLLGGVSTADLCFRIMPIQNPAGYDAFTRQNARGVDLNRNFDIAWEELPVPQDVVTPWDYNYKGARAASEPETQIIQRIIDECKPVCVIDFHTADYFFMLPHAGDDALSDAIHAAMKADLKDRFLVQAPYNGAYQQVNMDRKTERDRKPYLICYAAERGCPAAILIELSGNRDDVHGLVIATDQTVTMCLSAARECAKWTAKAARRGR